MRRSTKIFDDISSTYDSWYLQPKGKQVFDAERRALATLIPEDGVGLEIGGGTGIFTSSLTSLNRTVISLDISSGMLVSSMKRGVPSILGSAYDLPIRENCMDFTYMVTVIEFMEEPSRALIESKRILKRGCCLVILFINRESSWGEYYLKLGETGNSVFRTAHLYDSDMVESFLKSSNLKVLEVVGTLTTGPTDLDPGDDITIPSKKTGVILLKAVKI